MKELFLLLKPHVRKHFKFLSIVAISTFFAAGFETLIPFQIGILIDTVIKEGDKSALFTGFLMLVGFGVGDWLMNFISRFFVVRFAQHVIFDIRQSIFDTLQDQELDFYAQESVGQIMSRSIEEVYTLRDILTWGLRITFLVTFLFISAFTSMFSTNPILGMVFVIIPVVMLIVIQRIASKNSALFYDARYKFGDLSDNLAQNLMGIQTVKAFGREAEQLTLFNEKNVGFYEASMKTAGVRSVILPGMVFLISISLVLLVFIGGYFVATGTLEVGQFIAFMLISLNIAVPGRFIGWIGIVLQDANSAAIRLNEIYKADVSIKNQPGAREITEIKGDITFENVSFSYGDRKILEDINLHIPAGQKVALLGATGAGKSTLIDLIPRLFDPTSGRILIDGMDIKKEFTIKSLRSHVGTVHQESFLFTLSLQENIAFSKTNVKRQEVIEAAKTAQIHEFIHSLDDEYDTMVGERGVTLSGGQRQRVTIARTILEDPKILIFDDSVSAIDPLTEARIQENLSETDGLTTTIVISQRPSSLRYVDRVIVLDKGKKVQDGTHEELIAVDGIYKDFLTAVEEQVKFMDWDEAVVLEGEKQ